MDAAILRTLTRIRRGEGVEEGRNVFEGECLCFFYSVDCAYMHTSTPCSPCFSPCHPLSCRGNRRPPPLLRLPTSSDFRFFLQTQTYETLPPLRLPETSSPLLRRSFLLLRSFRPSTTHSRRGAGSSSTRDPQRFQGRLRSRRRRREWRTVQCEKGGSERRGGDGR